MILVTPIISGFLGQDVGPPKPKSDGPSLEETMKFLEERLGTLGVINFISEVHDKVTNEDAVLKFKIELSEVKADFKDCQIKYHIRVTRQNEKIIDLDASLGLKFVQEIAVKPGGQYLTEQNARDSHPEKSSRTEPNVFVIQPFFKTGNQTFVAYEEALANRIAKAMSHAVELCGGGNKDPF